jgi:hypothetical protein
LFRTVTSNVSAVSSFVANSHQSLQYVSSSPSEIPYIGVSPIRLQTGIQPHPSLTTTGLSARSAFTYPSPTYTWPKLLTQRGVFPQHRWLSRNRAIAQAALPSISATALQSRGPWLTNGLCCPIGSSLTMASSESLDPSRRFIFYYDGSSPYDLVWAGIKRLPNLLHVSFPSVPPSVPRQTERLHMTVPSPFTLAFTIFALARHPQLHARRFSHGSCNEAAKFALCYGPEGSLALHRQGHLPPSFHLSESPPRDVGYTMRAYSQFPQPDLHRPDTRPYGLQTKDTKSTWGV